MNTETKELTNEMVAEALGGYYALGTEVWFLPKDKINCKGFKVLPDFFNDMNAWKKYVWPEYKRLCEENHIGTIAMLEDIWIGLLKDNSAKYLCERFMEFKHQ